MLKKIKKTFLPPAVLLQLAAGLSLTSVQMNSQLDHTANFTRLQVSYHKVYKGSWAVDPAVGLARLTLLPVAVIN